MSAFVFEPDLLQPVSAPTESITYALEHDSEFFINFFLGDELEYPVPVFHEQVFSKMISTNIKKFACAIPRGHAKTTLAKLAIIWLFLFTRYRFIVYLSNTAQIAVSACHDIVKFITSDNFTAVFGPVQFDINQIGNGLYKFTLGKKVCILRALGAGQQVRGINIDNQRPEVAVVDDLEDTDNTATELLYEKLKNWFYGTFLKCMDPIDNKIVQIGNMIAARCLLKEHCDSASWHSMRFGSLLSNGRSLWPDLWPIWRLKQDLQEYIDAGKIDIWYAEMMNYPMAPGTGVIRANEITYRPPPLPGDQLYGFITVDPAISDKTWAHKAAIWVHVFDGLHWHLPENISGTGMDPLQIYNAVMELAFRWHIHAVGIESQQYQAALKPMFEYLCRMQGMEHMNFIPLLHYTAKSQRISSWAAMLKNKEYVLPSGNFELTTELLTFNPNKKDNADDNIDCCAFGPQMIQGHIVDIMHSVPHTTWDVKPLNCYDISAV